MKRWKKITAGILGMLLLLLLSLQVITLPTHAKEAQITLDVPEQIKNGESFTLTVNVESVTALAGIDARIVYNPEVVAFVGDEEGKMTGSDGLVNLKEMYESETNKKSYNLTFEAIAVGESQFAFDKTYITDYAQLEEIEIHSNEKTMQVLENNKISDNADLAELLVATGELSPAFSPEVTEYTVSVEHEEDTFIFSSVPADAEAVVAVDMPETLCVGENQITITVTAPSGAEKQYFIYVNRAE
ncbi:MAG: cadherin-like beta sandwich domain-containing protein [Lachnospiraceae bacterium]|nr:cadherin-like beta sandwich domain-containing protein [Lachnospiraceae bacterium]